MSCARQRDVFDMSRDVEHAHPGDHSNSPTFAMLCALTSLFSTRYGFFSVRSLSRGESLKRRRTPPAQCLEPAARMGRLVHQSNGPGDAMTGIHLARSVREPRCGTRRRLANPIASPLRRALVQWYAALDLLGDEPTQSAVSQPPLRRPRSATCPCDAELAATCTQLVRLTDSIVRYNARDLLQLEDGRALLSIILSRALHGAVLAQRPRSHAPIRPTARCRRTTSPWCSLAQLPL
jgi:hypothetical protein